MPAGLRQSVTSLVGKLCTAKLFQPDWRLHFENSFVQIGEFLICKLRLKRRVSSDHAGMNNISAEVSIFCLWTNWIHLVTCSAIEFRELYYCSRCALDKICEIYTSIAVHRGGLAKNHFWIVATQKKRTGVQLNYFWNMCPKPFSRTKKKRKLFSRGKSRGPLSARASLNWSSSESVMKHQWTGHLVKHTSASLLRDPIGRIPLAIISWRIYGQVHVEKLWCGVVGRLQQGNLVL